MRLPRSQSPPLRVCPDLSRRLQSFEHQQASRHLLHQISVLRSLRHPLRHLPEPHPCKHLTAELPWQDPAREAIALHKELSQKRRSILAAAQVRMSLLVCSIEIAYWSEIVEHILEESSHPGHYRFAVA